MKERLQQLQDDSLLALQQAGDLKALQGVRVQVLGKKGTLTEVMKGMRDLAAEERPAIGSLVNTLKTQFEDSFVARQLELQQQDIAAKLANEKIDVTLPGRKNTPGSLHPVTLVTDEVIEIFSRLGFAVAEGPEIEQDFYNFEALNIPKDHPARDMQDTFYISDDRVTFGNLKGVLTHFLNEFFGAGHRVRFRPSFFPFTEPSAEVDIECVICGGSGCRVCGKTGWLEILGCGMIDPEVFKSVNYDAEKYSGFAFGMGLERMAMLKYGVNDLRLFFENDLRFLKQF